MIEPLMTKFISSVHSSSTLIWIHSLNRLVSLASLLLILDDVLLLKLTHALYFIKIHNEALVISM